MNEEIQLVVQAIEGLRQPDSIVKDYIFPILSAFFAALFGGLVAYLMFLRQERIQTERSKIEAANKWTLAVEEAFGTLLSIKNSYHGDLTDNPIQRTAKVPTILLLAEPITVNTSDLFFLIPKDLGLGSKYPKWSQLPRIRTMKANFNLLITYWIKRNDIDRPIKEKLIQEYSEVGFANVSVEKIIDCIGGSALTSLIDLTEQTLKLTDDLLIELNSFLYEFPDFAKSKIDEKLVKKYGCVMKYSVSGNQHIERLLERSPAPDFKHIEWLFGDSTENIQKRYETGYEDGINKRP